MGAKAKLAAVVVGLVLLFNPTLFRDVVDAVSVAARGAAGDQSRETAFRAFAALVDRAEPTRASSGSAHRDDAFSFADLVPSPMLDAVRSAWQAVAAVLPAPSAAQLQLDRWKELADNFHVEKTECPPAAAGSAATADALHRPVPGDRVELELVSLTGTYDGSLRFPRSGSLGPPTMPLSVAFMKGDVIFGIDRSVEALFSEAAASVGGSGGYAVRPGCRVQACFGGNLGFGRRGYWKWRVLPYEPLCAAVVVRNVTSSAASATARTDAAV